MILKVEGGGLSGFGVQGGKIDFFHGWAPVISWASAVVFQPLLSETVKTDKNSSEN
jgi:hypothetical protein